MPTVFPYQPDWVRPAVATKRIFTSTSVSGATKARTKTETKRSFELKFSARDKTEFEAALAFHAARYPGTTFTYRDETVSPSVDIDCRFTSDFSYVANMYNDYDYSFTCIEI